METGKLDYGDLATLAIILKTNEFTSSRKYSIMPKYHLMSLVTRNLMFYTVFLLYMQIVLCNIASYFVVLATKEK